MSTLKLNYESIEEVPEALRQYCSESKDDDGNTVIEYKADVPVSALKKERSAKAEIEKALREKEAEIKALKESRKDEKSEKPEEQDQQSRVLAEYDKRIKALQEQLDKKEQQTKQQQKASYVASLGNEAGMQPKAVKLIEDEIGHDEKGFFVIDEDGTPMIDMNGNRMNPRDYLESKRKSDPWMFKGKPSGPSERPGMSPKSRTIIDQLHKQAAEAKERGDVKTQLALARKARQYGG